MAAEHRIKDAVEEWRTQISARFSLDQIVRLEQANGDAIATILAEALLVSASGASSACSPGSASISKSRNSFEDAPPRTPG